MIVKELVPYQELLQALRLGSFRRGIEFQDDILIAVAKDVWKASGHFEEKRGLVGGPSSFFIIQKSLSWN